MRALSLIAVISMFGSFCHEVGAKNDENTCKLESSVYLDYCSSVNGTKLHLGKSLVVPALTVCTFKFGENVTKKQCDENGAFLQLAGDLVSRQKRNDLEAVLGTAIGAYFGGFLGGAIGGFIGSKICIFFCEQKEHQDPPQIFCGNILQSTPIYALKGTKEAKVSWGKTTATDDEDGNLDGNVILETKELVSGQSFRNGKYSVRYSVMDSTKRRAECTIEFEVKLITCEPASTQENGKISCDNDLIYGSKCNITCGEGYELGPFDSNTVECKHDGKGDGYWYPTVSSCRAKPCNRPWQTIPNGQITCPNNEASYGISCKVVCATGYKIDGDALTICESNGQLKKIYAVCKDITSPLFDSCPSDFQVNIDSAENTAEVSWDPPSGTDNNDKTPGIKEVHNYAPGQIFKAGTYSVQYDIKDNAGNKGRSCLFQIAVKTISCDPPDLNVIGAEFMDYECKDLYRFGASCELSCRSGYPLGGVTEIKCENDDKSDPPVLRWQWDKNGLEPFCKVTPCPDLKAPGHGALACSLWEHGNMCQMQCEEGYDVPIIRGGMFVCGQSDGLWRLDDYVPDCITKRNAHQMNLRSELFYYSGQCNSSKENIIEIQENFVKALNVSKFHEFCVGVPECQGQFVNVTCGAIETRMKRDTHEGIVKRDTKKQFAYKVEFILIVPYKEKAGMTSLESISEQQNLLYDMIDAVEKDFKSDHFDIEVGDLQTGKDSLNIGSPELSCPLGHMPRIQTGTCVGCPSGKFFSTEISDCEYCPIGTYQDTAGSVTCKECPESSNTTKEGAKSRAECKPFCEPGHFSNTGSAPCQMCPSSSFQPHEHQTSCIPCGNGLRTVQEASTKKEECQVFDIAVKSGKPVKFKIDKNSTTLTLISWLQIRRARSSDNLFLLNSTDSDFVLEIKSGKKLFLNLNGQTVYLNESLRETEWTLFVMTVDAATKMLQFYLNGNPIATNETIKFTRDVSFADGDMLIIDADTNIAGFHILERIISPSEVTSFSSTCFPRLNDSVYTMDDLLTSHTAMVVIPSICDAVDECKSNPCTNHTCINGNGSYKCVCNGGFSGNNCEMPPDYCLGHNCMNGATCINGQTDYTCMCAYGFKGSLCEITAVNGQWSDWTSWTSCSKTCGGGVAERRRHCDNPTPDAEGQDCQGHSNDTTVCNTDTCPECIALQESYGVTLKCNETEYLKRCTISCTPGLFFATSPLDYYDCGKLTNYMWNHQTDENPKGRLPACTEAEPPNNLKVSFDGRYETIACSERNISVVNTRLQTTIKTIECVKEGYCTASIASIVCEAGGKRRKRSAHKALIVTIEMKSNVDSDGSGYHIKELLQNKTAPSSDLITYMKQSISLESSAQKLINDSINFFRVIIEGINYTVGNGENGLSFTSSVQCQSGSVPFSTFCAECPEGSFSDGLTVTMCPRGQYQDHKGQTSCKSCPVSYTTPGIGSVSVSECSVTLKWAENSDSSPLEIAVGVSCSVGFLITAVAIAVFVYKYKGKRQNKVDQSFTEIPYRDVYFSKPVFDKTAVI